jgi:hypothetical protein
MDRAEDYHRNVHTGQMLPALSSIMSRNVLALRAASSDQGHFLAFAALRTRTFAEQSSPQSKACRHRHALVGSGMGSGGLCCLRHPRPLRAASASRPAPRSGCCSRSYLGEQCSGLRATGRDRPLAQSMHGAQGGHRNGSDHRIVVVEPASPRESAS